MSEQPVLTDDELTLRPLVESDLEVLGEHVRDPQVARWWGRLETPEQVRDDLATGDFNYTIEIAGAIAGWVGINEEDDPDYKHAALDIFLAATHHGRGYGRRTLRLAIDWLVAGRGHHRFTIDPAADNTQAIRVYEAVGFAPVGIMRDYARDTAGEWRDGLLMDLLARDLDIA